MPREPKIQKTIAYTEADFDRVKAAAEIKGELPAAYVRRTSVEASKRDLAKLAKAEKKGGAA